VFISRLDAEYIDPKEYDLLFNSNDMFDAWVQEQELAETRKQLKLKILSALFTQKFSEEFSPYNTVNS